MKKKILLIISIIFVLVISFILLFKNDFSVKYKSAEKLIEKARKELRRIFWL